MISSLLTLALSTIAPEGVSASDLFTKLDKNSDGQLTQAEMAGPQQSMFKRALRVADGNEDSALNKDEFANAVSDPKPVELPGANMGERMASFDVSRLDRNGDGNVSLDEVPAPMRERFEQLLDRINQKSVPVDKVQAYLRGEQPGFRPPSKEPEEMMEAEKDRMKRDEPKVQPKSLPGKAGDRKGKPGQPMENAGPAAIFKQLDRNSDGKLTGNEIPSRMQENMKAADTDDDGSISPSEMQAAIQRRMQNQKK